MEKYYLLASWIGWPIVTSILLLIGSFGAFFYKKHIDILQDTNAFLEKQVDDLRNFTPDVVANRLFAKSKILEDEIESLALDNEKDKLRKTELEEELAETHTEAQALRIQLENIQDILEDMSYPREAKIKSHIARDILGTVDSHGCIFVSLWLWGDHDENEVLNLNERRPYRYNVIYPGMHKMYVHFYDNNDKDIGYVTSPYLQIYSHDYFLTLVELFKYLPNEMCKNVRSANEEETFILPSANFHCISPIHRNTIYLKIDVSNDEKISMQENLADY